MVNVRNSVVVLAVLCALLTAVASCGGGSSSNKPQNVASLSGQLFDAGSGHIVSQAGNSLQGAVVKLINGVTGELFGTDVTDADGMFEFPAVPSGHGYLVKVDVSSDADLDGDGQPDPVEVVFPVALANQSNSWLSEIIGLVDGDGDGAVDTVEVQIAVSDDKGNSDQEHRMQNHRSGETMVDDDGDGDFEDSEESFADGNHDGLPDDAQGHENSLHGGQYRGAIEEITADSITVDGVTFQLTEATEWKDRGNENPDPAAFAVGVIVKIDGLYNGESWIALEVKTSGPRDGDDENLGGDDDGGADDGDGSDVDDDGGADDTGGV